MIFFGRSSLERALVHYMSHCHRERNRQGLKNLLLRPAPHAPQLNHPVRRRQRLGGMLNYYYRAAA